MNLKFLRVFNVLLMAGLLAFLLTYAVMIALAHVDTPTPGPTDTTVTLCLDPQGKTNPIVTVGLASPGEAFVITCRIIAANGVFLRNAAEIGNQSVLDMGVIHAVEVFAADGSSINGTNVCLLGVGNLIYMNSANSPRIPVVQVTTTVGQYTCTLVPNSGTVIMVPGSGNPAPAATEGAAAAPPVVGTLTNCHVSIRRIVRLRTEPNTDSDIITRLPYQLTLQATDYVPGWYQVIYLNGQGWVSADFVTPIGAC